MWCLRYASRQTDTQMAEFHTPTGLTSDLFLCRVGR